MPARADGVELLGAVPGSGYRKPPALARRADGQTVALTTLLYLVLSAIDGQRSYVDIADRVSSSTRRLVRLADGTEPEVRKANPLLGVPPSTPEPTTEPTEPAEPTTSPPPTTTP